LSCGDSVQVPFTADGLKLALLNAERWVLALKFMYFAAATCRHLTRAVLICAIGMSTRVCWSLLMSAAAAAGMLSATCSASSARVVLMCVLLYVSICAWWCFNSSAAAAAAAAVLLLLPLQVC
jgi:hypothetical protein